MVRCWPLPSCKHRNGHATRRIFAAGLLSGLVIISGHAHASGEAVPLQLEVFINGSPVHLIGSFEQMPNSRIGTRLSELKELGIKAPPAGATGDFILLDEIPNLTYQYQPQTQSIDIRIGATNQISNIFDASEGPPPAEVQVGSGAVTNYSLFASGAAPSSFRNLTVNGLSATVENRIYGPYGTFSNSGIARDLSETDAPFLRLDTTWTLADPGGLRSYSVGDFVSGGLPWTRPIRMSGVQIASNFGLRPDLITRPLPSFAGTAVVPSTVDVYINNTMAYSREVPAGPFEINNVPVVTNSGTARLVVRDASGQETETAAAFFASSQMLRQGLFDYSGELGFARQQYGIKSDVYSDTPVGSFSGRYGVSDIFNVAAHAEAAPTLLNLGLGLTSQLWSWGRATAAGSVSDEQGQFGEQAYAALELQACGFDLHASTQWASATFTDLGVLTAEKSQSFASFGNPLAPFYAIRPPRAIDQISLALPPLFDDTRPSLTFLRVDNGQLNSAYDIVSASYSRPLWGDVSLYSTVFKTLGGSNGLGAYVGLSMPLGERGNATALLTQNNHSFGYGVDYMKPLGVEPDSFGWRLRAVNGAGQQSEAELSYRSGIAEMRGRVTDQPGGPAGTAEMSGSVVAANGDLFLANRIDDAFAIVDAGAADVDVLFENRRVATTDGQGRALVTGLRSYQSAKISIDPTHLPINADLPLTQVNVTPADHSGVAVRFGVRSKANSALLVFRFPDGNFVPVGSVGHIEGQEQEFIIGYDGQAYVTDLAATNKAVVDHSTGGCRAEFAYQSDGSSQIVIDPVVCQ